MTKTPPPVRYTYTPSVPVLPAPDLTPELIEAIKARYREAQERMFSDAVLHGVGVSADGTHVRVAEIYDAKPRTIRWSNLT